MSRRVLMAALLGAGLLLGAVSQSAEAHGRGGFYVGGGGWGVSYGRGYYGGWGGGYRPYYGGGWGGYYSPYRADYGLYSRPYSRGGFYRGGYCY